MGDPHSPGMCIGTCAWMENEWMQMIPEEAKECFIAKRYMDDLLMFYRDDEKYDTQKIVQHSNSECYFPPLKLEAGKDGTFLESRFMIEDNKIRYRIKNDNENGKEDIWRYMHYDSHTTKEQKITTLST